MLHFVMCLCNQMRKRCHAKQNTTMTCCSLCTWKEHPVVCLSPRVCVVYVPVLYNELIQRAPKLKGDMLYAPVQIFPKESLTKQNKPTMCCSLCTLKTPCICAQGKQTYQVGQTEDLLQPVHNKICVCHCEDPCVERACAWKRVHVAFSQNGIWHLLCVCACIFLYEVIAIRREHWFAAPCAYKK